MPDPKPHGAAMHLRLTKALSAAVIAVLATWSGIFSIARKLDLPVTTPWGIYRFMWDNQLHPDIAHDIETSLRISLLIGLIAFVVIWADKARTYYGDARWANLREVYNSAMLAKSGLLLGSFRGQFLRNNEPAHIAAIAATRSGKTSGIAKPNLLSWPGSIIAVDVKHELYQETAGFRSEHGQNVFMWSPADHDARSHCFNPLDTVRKDPNHRISDLQDLAATLFHETSDPLWHQQARDLFVGLALYVIDAPGIPATIGEIYRTLKTREETSDVFRYILEKHGEQLDPNVTMAFSNFINTNEKTRCGYKANITGALSLWANPVIDAATSRSDFSFADLRKRPTSLYIGVKEDQLLSLGPLVTMYLQQAVRVLRREIPGPDEPLWVTILIDEFATLGRMPVIKDALATIAGYNVRIVYIVQGIGQLDEIYGTSAREAMLQNTAVRVYFSANDKVTAEYISEQLGTTTIRTQSSNKAAGATASGKSTSHAPRPLMRPEEVRQLNPNRQIIFKESRRPILATKIRYYKSAIFKKRIRAAPPVPPLDVVRRMPPQIPSDDAAQAPSPSGAPEAAKVEVAQADDLESLAAELEQLITEQT